MSTSAKALSHTIRNGAVVIEDVPVGTFEEIDCKATIGGGKAIHAATILLVTVTKEHERRNKFNEVVQTYKVGETFTLFAPIARCGSHSTPAWGAPGRTREADAELSVTCSKCIKHPSKASHGLRGHRQDIRAVNA